MTGGLVSIPELRAACGDGTGWEDVDEKRGPMAVVSPESVLDLVEAVEAAIRFERAYQRSLGSASVYDHERRNETQAELLAALAKFSFEAAAEADG